MIMNDILKIGEVCEVVGKKVKIGVYSSKNSEFINYNGQIIKNVSIGSFVLIKKGYKNIIAKVEGEFIKADPQSSTNYEEKGNIIKRILEVTILGIFSKKQFIHGLSELPLIGNYCYILENTLLTKIFLNEGQFSIKLGHLIDYPSYGFKVDAQKLLCSHIGIFGNTGSGKSNTLAKLYKTTFDVFKKNNKFKTNTKFILLDFNGEYGKVFGEDAVYFDLSTKQQTRYYNQYELTKENLKELDFWAILLEATEKTQRPFIKRVLRRFNEILEGTFTITTKELSNIVIRNQNKFNEIKYHLYEIFEDFSLLDNFSKIEDCFEYNANAKQFHIGNNYNISEDDFFSTIFDDDKVIDIYDIYKSNYFKLFYFTMLYCYFNELGRNFVSKEHIGPLIARANAGCRDLNKIFKIVTTKSTTLKNVEIISLFNLNISMKKFVPMVICKILYEAKKEKKNGEVDSTLHIIIDEAHNILSTMSSRESEEWKDYRLECFEEIIKEGRKFGVFLTISSQRPSDISETLISQLHNYFIHRLVNEEDLRRIYRSVAFLDKASNEMISILPPGGCIFSGTSSNFPILAQIDILSKNSRPQSENIDLLKVWID